jgi:hypothetical protein
MTKDSSFLRVLCIISYCATFHHVRRVKKMFQVTTHDLEQHGVTTTLLWFVVKPSNRDLIYVVYD